MNKLNLSYIVPAFNEEYHLPRLLDSIRKHTPAAFTYEVIVADHGSQDRTMQIAKQYGAILVETNAGTVGGLRNLGAGIAHAPVLVFLDADVVLTEAWGKRFPEVYRQLEHNPLIVTGSVCGIPEDASWIERFWFEPLTKRNVRYINSGHLITTRRLFDQITGFSETLQTGEDYDFSVRARATGAVISNNPELHVIHSGYPSTLDRFVAREIWHGNGDCQNWRSVVQSRVAMTAMAFTILHLIGAGSLIVTDSIYVVIGAIIGIVVLCVSAAIIKHRQRSIAGVVVTASLYYLYFSARALSCIKALLRTSPQKRRR